MTNARRPQSPAFQRAGLIVRALHEDTVASATVSKTRSMKARPPLVVRPLFVSQETAFAVLGITPRKFREWIVPMCRGFVARVGKSALIPVDVAEGKLRSLAAAAEGLDAEDDSELEEDPPDDDEPQTVDAILHALGRRRAR